MAIQIYSKATVDHARNLLKTGATALRLETTLGLPLNEGYRLITQVRMEEELLRNPSILERVEKIVHSGGHKFVVRKELGVTLDAAEYLIHVVSSKHSPEKAETIDRSRTELLNSVARLVEDGAGKREIANEVSVPVEQVSALITELQADDKAASKKLEAIARMHDDGRSAWDIAKSMQTTVSNVQTKIKEVEGQNIIDNALKKALAKRPTLFELQNKFGFKNREQVVAAIQDVFPAESHIIIEKSLDDGDIHFTIVRDVEDQFSWLSSNNESKDFRISFGKDEEPTNYLFVKMKDTYPYKRIRIYNLTDVHVGSKHFDAPRFLRDVDMIRKDPHAFVVLGGDIIEWAHKMSVGEPWEQLLKPMDQVREAVKILTPIKHKILAYRSGNHDKDRGKAVGADLAETIATMLQVPYFTVEAIIDIQLRDQFFTVILDHGQGGGSSLQAILRDAEKFRAVASFKVHAHFSGHVHNAQIHEWHMKDRDIGVGLSYPRSYTIIGGSWMKYSGTYAEENKYAPTPQDLTYFECFDDGTYSAGKIAVDPQ